MRLILLLALVAAAPAHADLYRWIDPETGTVKLSSVPPSDPRVNADLVRYNGPAPLPKPAALPNATTELEMRWRALLGRIAALTPEDLKTRSESLRQQFEAFDAVKTQLDRADPGGIERRNAEAAPLLERLRQGAAAQR